MNPVVTNWLYLILIISIAYWLIVLGLYLFPGLNPFFISIIVLIIIYIVSNQQNVILLF